MRTVTRRHRRLARTAILLATAALTLAGCGGARTVKVTGTVLRVRLDEFRITPQVVQVPAGRLKIIAFNTGVLTHNLKVERGTRDTTGQPDVLGGTPTALPGQEVETKVTLTPGHYLLVDTLANHVDLGQFGTLIVK